MNSKGTQAMNWLWVGEGVKEIIGVGVGVAGRVGVGVGVG